MRDNIVDFLREHIITDDILQEYEHTDETRKVKAAKHFRVEVSNIIAGKHIESGDRLPWNKTRDMRFRPGELTIWTGYNGHKKSMVLGQVVVGFVSQGRRICIASPEMSPARTLHRMIRQYAAQKYPDIDEQNRFFDFLGDDVFLYAQRGNIKTKNIVPIIRYCADRLKVNHFVIDSLMKCGINEDDLNGQKTFVDNLTNVAQDLSIHVHLVAHQKKPTQGTSHQAGGVYGVAGSGNITNLADNVISVFEFEKKDDCLDDRPTQYLHVKKQRNYEGDDNPQPTYGFWFDNESLQFLEKQNSSPMPPNIWDAGKLNEQ